MKRTFGITLLAVLALVPWAFRARPVDIIWIPLSLSGSNVFVYTNAFWWTNSSPPTNIETWQAWWAMRENVRRITNAIATPNLYTNGHPAAADAPGAAFWGNSNSWVYLLQSSPGSSAWAATNLIGKP